MCARASAVRRTASPWRVQTDCGMISPKMRMKPVERTAPRTPLVMVAVKMARKELTMALPMSSVHSSRLPRRLMGKMRSAFFFSRGEPPAIISCN
eukprot:3513712-Pleurochrysis_carterae.AAC.2